MKIFCTIFLIIKDFKNDYEIQNFHEKQDNNTYEGNNGKIFISINKVILNFKNQIEITIITS